MIVAAAIIEDGRLLGCARAYPRALAGYWELPGGKVEPGEPEQTALARECREELAVTVRVGRRFGDDLPITGGGAVLRVYLATLVGEQRPQALEHAALRWLSAEELDSVPWLPADTPIIAALSDHLRSGDPRQPTGVD